MIRIGIGLLMALASAGVVGAAECRGAGSATVLTFPNWELVGNVARLDYRLSAEKPVTKVQSHLYFTMAPDVTFAHMGLDVGNEAGLAKTGSLAVDLSAAERRALKQAVHGDVIVYACVNVIEFTDGSGTIID
jgi:hypothetical protein